MFKQRELGKTGIFVSEIGLGTAPIGGNLYGLIDYKQAEKVIQTYLENGGNLLDTANAYGESEVFIGRTLANMNNTNKVLIATKTFAGEVEKTIPDIKKQLEQSLKDLKRDYVDIYYLHQPPEDPEVMSKVLDEMEKFKKEGKIRLIGASIKGPNVTEKTEDMCRQYLKDNRVDVFQIVYSILRQPLINFIKEAHNAGKGIVARTSLETGLLTGKFKPGHNFDTDIAPLGKGWEERSRYKKENLDYILKAAQEIEKESVVNPYKSLAQVAIRFSLAPKEISCLLVGARTEDQIQKNIITATLPELNKEIVENLKTRYGGFDDKMNYFSGSGIGFKH